MFDKIVEAKIREALERGEFDNLPNQGRPIDLSAYFETPEDVRLAQSMLRNAGMTPREVDLLREIAGLKQVLAGMLDEKRKQSISKQIHAKQIEFSLMMEKSRGQRSKSQD